MCWGYPDGVAQEKVAAVKVLEDTLTAYQLRTFSPSFLQQFRKDPLFSYRRQEVNTGWWEQWQQWLDKYVFRSFHLEGWEDWGNTVLKVSAGILFLFLVYKLIRGKYFFSFVRRKKDFETGEGPAGPGQKAEFYGPGIQQAVQAGRYALALRLYYGYLLQLMDEKEIIHWERWKTNTSYQQEIRKESLRKAFERLSRIFNCVCYGEFEIDAVLYRQLEQEFKDFQREITA